MAVSIGELLNETGKLLLPKRHVLNEEGLNTSNNTIVRYDIKQEEDVSQDSPHTIIPPSVCNLNFNDLTIAGSTLQPTAEITTTAAAVSPQIKKPGIQQSSKSSRSLLRSKLAGYELLKSKPGHRVTAPGGRPFPSRVQRKSRSLGSVSKKTEKLIIESNESYINKTKALDEEKISHSVTHAVLSFTKRETTDEIKDTAEEINEKEKEKAEEIEEEEEEEGEEEEGEGEGEEEGEEGEKDDIVPPLQSEVCPLEPREKENLKRNIHRRSSLYLDVELVNFNAEMTKKTKTIINKFRGGVIYSLEHISEDVREDYESFLNEIDDVVFYAYRQAERMLTNYTPQTIVLISSAVPKAQYLLSIIKPGVLGLIYDVDIESYSSLLDKIKGLLESYKPGAKAKRLAIVCKGGPGYMYLLKSKPITPVKLLKEEDLLKFWKTLGSYMSKLTLRDPSTVHIMESNVAGTPQGTELLSNLESAMFCHQVKVESPLELGPKGREMIATYFQSDKFSVWKSRRYSKFKLYK